MTLPNDQPLAPQHPLSIIEVRERLEALVDPVLSSRRSVRATAETLGQYGRPVQQRFLESVDAISRTSVELAFNFSIFAPPALRILAPEAWHDWIAHLLERYDQGGVIGCIGEIRRVDEYIAARDSCRCGVTLEDVATLLGRFLCGLNGRSLKLAPAEETYTDTEVAYLPPRLTCFSAREDNYLLYKAMATHLWAQTWFGTWQVDMTGEWDGFSDSLRARRLFHALEARRLDGFIRQQLPGLYREMRRLRTLAADEPKGALWLRATRRLDRPGATVADCVELLPDLYRCRGFDATPPCYAGSLYPERVDAVRKLRLERDRRALQLALGRLRVESLSSFHGSHDLQLATGDSRPFEAIKRSDSRLPEGFEIVLRLEGRPLRPPEDVRQLMASILQDLGEIPNHYLVPAGDGCYRLSDQGKACESHEELSIEEGSYAYDEWDYVRGRYRRNWCRVRERPLQPGTDDFVAKTLRKHRGLLKHLYRVFEALRGDEKRLRHQQDGDQVDIDAVVECYADVRSGREGSPQLFSQLRRVDRNIAVLFMVDMSGSTRGWVSEIERESLVLLCESLEILGDRYAIYGFSGFTHKRCELFRVKHFNDPYGDVVKARISAIKPRDYTRMGASIRHLTDLLLKEQARTHLLIALSDGRPDDQDGYRGTYGVEDTRQALIEARSRGVYSYCITIDDKAMAYLPRMYGASGFTLVSDVNKLPWKVSEIYRRLTL